MAKSRKVVFSGCSGHSGQNGPRGRLGPPESVEKHGKHGKHGKQLFSCFLRVPRAVGQGCSYRGNRRLSGSVPGKPGTGHLAPPGSRTGGIPNRSAASCLPPLGRLRLPRPHPIVRGPEGPLPPLVVLGCLTFGKEARRQFPCLAPKGAATGASSSFLASLAASRRQPG